MDLTISLYETNLEAAGRLFQTIGNLEVALSNAYNSTMKTRWGGSTNWLLDGTSPVQVAIYRRNDSGTMVD